jgi:hypothetical protein
MTGASGSVRPPLGLGGGTVVPRPGLAAESPAVTLRLHELETVPERSPNLSDGGDVLVREAGGTRNSAGRQT